MELLTILATKIKVGPKAPGEILHEYFTQLVELIEVPKIDMPPQQKVVLLWLITMFKQTNIYIV